MITPHVITEEEDNFSRVIPQDDKRFDQVDNLSFPNSYRVKREMYLIYHSLMKAQFFKIS